MKYYYICIVGIVILCAILKAAASKIKGLIGELSTGAILSTLPKEEYYVLNNIMISSERGTAQIDHIVVSVYGIFVIETKNYKGWITGGEFSDKWTKNVYGKKYQFQNPLKQNYGHVKALEKLLDIPEDKFIPIVVFAPRADIKFETKAPVIYTTDLKRRIFSYGERKIDVCAIPEIITGIENGNIKSKDARKEHVRKIKKEISHREDDINHNICPRCGEKLVKRTGRYGDFMGCSNYPKCRFTEKTK